MKILVVDDDPQIRETVTIALERASFDVIPAADAKLALTHAGRENPDLIVLDVGLPEMDGFEVCRKIRATSDVPILFLTALDDEVDAISLNIDAHVCDVSGTDVALTGTEMKILTQLMQANGKAVGRVALINALWGARSDVSDRTLDSHLRNLRGKLAKANAEDAVQTIHGVGIRMAP